MKEAIHFLRKCRILQPSNNRQTHNKILKAYNLVNPTLDKNNNQEKYIETGKTSSPTRKIGVQAVIEVLLEDAKFPKKLLERQGWKVIAWKNGKEVKLKEMLEKYKDIIEVWKELNKTT